MQISCVFTDTPPRPHASSTWSISAVHTTDNSHQKVPTQGNCTPQLIVLLRSPHCESEFRLLPVVDRQTFQKQTAETRSNISATHIVHQETLKASAIVRQFPEAVQDKGNDFLANGVISTREIVGSVFLPRDRSLKVKQLPTCDGAHFNHEHGLQINDHFLSAVNKLCYLTFQ